MKGLSFRILLVFALGLTTAGGFAAQTPSSPGSQATINEEAQAAYRAGTAAATNNDFKTAEAEFEKVVRLVPQIEEGHSALGAVLIHLGKFPQAIRELETALKLNGLIRAYDPRYDDLKRPPTPPAADPRQMSLIE